MKLCQDRIAPHTDLCFVWGCRNHSLADALFWADPFGILRYLGEFVAAGEFGKLKEFWEQWLFRHFISQAFSSHLVASDRIAFTTAGSTVF